MHMLRLRIHSVIKADDKQTIRTKLLTLMDEPNRAVEAIYTLVSKPRLTSSSPDRSNSSPQRRQSCQERLSRRLVGNQYTLAISQLSLLAGQNW